MEDTIMIDPKELRIGNWVNYMLDDDNCIVKGAGLDGILVYFPKTQVETWVESDQFQPIDLTPKTLGELGFEFKNEDEYHITLDKPWTNIAITTSDNSVALYDSDDNYRVGNYIATSRSGIKFHNLQNLIFELTGKEYDKCPVK